MPHCNLCNCYIPPEEAVPYVAADGQPLQLNGKIQYRNWCLTHWSMRRGSLPPSHPNFLRPIDPRTRAADRRKLGVIRVTQADLADSVKPASVPSLLAPEPEQPQPIERPSFAVEEAAAMAMADPEYRKEL